MSPEEEFVLSHGLNFSIPPKKISREEILTEFEILMGQLKHHQANSVVDLRCFKRKLADTAYAYSGNSIDKSDFLMRKEFYINLQALKKLEHVIITKPDKGTGVVLMDRDDYIRKMSVILDDKSKFLALGPVTTHDNTEKTERKLIARLRQLVKEKKLPSEVQAAIRPTGSMRPRMYGLPKTHKPGTPLRPILAMIGSCQHNIAKWLAKALEPVLDHYSEFCIKDSFSFVTMLRDSDVNHESNVMCSFDIKSLFTNVPLNEVIDLCMETLYEKDTTVYEIQRETMRELLVFATTNVEFSFNDVAYQQTDGVAMGSPLGPILANIFVGAMEKRLYEITKRPNIYVRYMDDIFAVFDSDHERDSFLIALNSLHSSLKFTVEHEIDRKLPFLDVLVCRTPSKFMTSIYRKQTFTGNYIRWSSFCTKRRKLNLIACLVHRAIKICSAELLEDELGKIRSILANNGYPRTTVEAIIHRKMNESSAPPDRSDDQTTVSLRLPYIGNVSNKYVKVVREALAECYSGIKLRVILTSRAILPAARKDVLPIAMTSNVVYRFVCHCNKWYIGSTSRRLQTRIKEHVPKCVRTLIPSTDSDSGADVNLNLTQERAKAKSSVAEHLLDNKECLRHYNDNMFEIIARARSSYHLCVLESTYIMSWEPSLCKMKEFDYKLSLF